MRCACVTWKQADPWQFSAASEGNECVPVKQISDTWWGEQRAVLHQALLALQKQIPMTVSTLGVPANATSLDCNVLADDEKMVGEKRLYQLCSQLVLS